MGLLDRFKRGFKKKPLEESAEETPAADAVDELSVYSHMRVEVTSFDGQLLFVAKLMNPRGTTAQLHQYSESALSQDTEPVRVRIRGYHDRQRKAVYMEGVISPMPKHIWRVEDLTVARIGNDRAFFRLDLDLKARVTKLSGLGAGDQPCKLLNISVGGARIAAEQRYWEGDKLLLHVRLFEDRGISVLYCEVLRVIEKEGAPYEYGCQFMELTEAEEGKITQNLFDLQRKMRNARQ